MRVEHFVFSSVQVDAFEATLEMSIRNIEFFPAKYHIAGLGQDATAYGTAPNRSVICVKHYDRWNGAGGAKSNYNKIVQTRCQHKPSMIPTAPSTVVPWKHACQAWNTECLATNPLCVHNPNRAKPRGKAYCRAGTPRLYTSLSPRRE